jgi:FkbH-like protein
MTMPLPDQTRAELKALLQRRDPAFWPLLRDATRRAGDFSSLLFLSTLRRRARTLLPEAESPAKRRLRLALTGGYSLYPLQELIEHLLETAGYAAEIFCGKFDNYAAEIMDEQSDLYQFRPDAVLLLPAHKRCAYDGNLTDPPELPRRQAAELSAHLLDLCRKLHERTRAEILLSNFVLPAGFDPGMYRTRTLGSDWSFRKLVNLELGVNAPAFVHLCDAEFLAYRRGGVASHDARAWFESKQFGSPDLLADLAREAVSILASLHKGPKKVLVLDLDNTLWGGVIGDDGLEGIEIGDTSPRGEAFKAFQTYIRSLPARGVLLAVCSKNDPGKAREPFEKHPEMVLRMDDFVAFKANWLPKSENIRAIAAELNLGLDSFVFVDDNPAEIEIVRQFAPEVSTILLSADPADYVRQLQDSRHFEPVTLTAEDQQRTAQYRTEAERKVLLESATDMDAYLASLEMEAVIREFDAMDAPRISQLINKSNQFNLTTRRRSEAEVGALIGDPVQPGFTIRLKDRFGDHGLIAVVIGKIVEAARGRILEIDTWLMSCRVLNRQVEQETVNELVRIARLHGCPAIRGVYLPTAKNSMVRDLYPRLGFQSADAAAERLEFTLNTETFQPFPTHIHVSRRSYDASTSDREVAAHL